ncbi:hypothetical protein [Cellulosimicrobium marinum]|uniref:hypothetical protein n=1 Tax=Cellulosimicrobium marinum TaxID=1638992 RepID=UPI001E538AA3|nr:hypothetical protein [Cellulosimicrobium marinum]MCB7134995.1 hypothetical protein [Cellulosimicrobium marinum]
MATLERARAAKTTLRAEIADTDGVTGVGLTRHGPTARPHDTADRTPAEDWMLRVNVTSQDVDVPASVDGVDVEVRVVGAVTPL